MQANKKLKKCFDAGLKGGERHQGLLAIPSSTNSSQGHLNKAIHNFNAMTDFHEMNYSDWSASASFYTLY
ncbi:MAG: hypothetical protein Q7K43_02845, partial [Candidatus Woesearchaeota archaeon]|nr:hypothetical protein [Candidatus Woesearchaeota archaeon]